MPVTAERRGDARSKRPPCAIAHCVREIAGSVDVTRRVENHWIEDLAASCRGIALSGGHRREKVGRVRDETDEIDAPIAAWSDHRATVFERLEDVTEVCGRRVDAGQDDALEAAPECRGGNGAQPLAETAARLIDPRSRDFRGNACQPVPILRRTGNDRLRAGTLRGAQPHRDHGFEQGRRPRGVQTFRARFSLRSAGKENQGARSGHRALTLSQRCRPTADNSRQTPARGT